MYRIFHVEGGGAEQDDGKEGGCDYKLPLSEERAVERCAACPDDAKALKTRQANRDSVCKLGARYKVCETETGCKIVADGLGERTGHETAAQRK